MIFLYFSRLLYRIRHVPLDPDIPQEIPGGCQEHPEPSKPKASGPVGLQVENDRIHHYYFVAIPAFTQG